MCYCLGVDHNNVVSSSVASITDEGSQGNVILSFLLKTNMWWPWWGQGWHMFLIVVIVVIISGL